MIVDRNGRQLCFANTDPIVMDIDEVSGKQVATQRTDGVPRHLIRCKRRPTVEAPTGYLVIETPNRSVTVRDAASGETLRTYKLHDDPL